MRPVAQPERHNSPGLCHKLVPGLGAVVDDVVVAGEHPVRQPVVAHELPDVLLRVQLRALRWQGHDGDVQGHGQPLGDVPPSLVQQEHGMAARRDPFGHLDQEQLHRRDVAPRQDQPGRFALPRADRAEDVGRRRALVVGGGRARAP